MQDKCSENLKKVYIKTYGCQMNVYDSIKMADLLKPHGFVQTESQEDADLLILNTCHIREKAAEKVYSELGRIKKTKSDDSIVAVAGCVAQAEGNAIFDRVPWLNMVVGPQSYQNLPKLLEEVKRKKKWVIDLDFPEENKFDSLSNIQDTQGVSAFVSIQEGCDKFCHFCVVPYTRGAEYSRGIEEIYREVLTLASNGTKEIHLLGQNVSAFHGIDSNGDTWSLGKLIKRIAKIDGIERIRYTTSHPRDMVDEELFEAHATEKKLMPFLHLPVQSGSNKILKTMNRKHTREFYLEVIEKFRKARPDMVFSSDFIVGYPGETEEDFHDTINIVKEIEYSQCYSFKYSKRPGTPATTYAEQVPEEVKSARLLQLQELIKDYQTKFNSSLLGKTIPVLFDKRGRHDSQIVGKSEYMQSVFVTADDKYLNTIANVKITRVESNTLGGEIVE